MPSFEVLVEVQLRPGVADPEGATIERALSVLGFAGARGVRVGKAFRLNIEAPDANAAHQLAQAISERLLANPVTERALVSVMGVEEPPTHGQPPPAPP